MTETLGVRPDERDSCPTLFHYHSHIVTSDVRGILLIWDGKDYSCIQRFRTPYSVLGSVEQPRLGAMLCVPAFDLQFWRNLLKHCERNADEGTPSSAGSAVTHGATMGRFGPLSKLKTATKLNELVVPPQIIVGGTGIRVLSLEDLSDDAYPLLTVVFTPVLCLIMTASARAVTFFDATNGGIQASYDNVMLCGSSDVLICSAVLDDRERKFIVGHSNGTISVHNILNGATMKLLDPHHDQVSGMVYCKEAKSVISVSWDSTLHIANEEDNAGWNEGARQSVLLRKAKMQSFAAPHDAASRNDNVDFTGVAFSETFNVFVTSARGGAAPHHLHIWDFEFLKLRGTFM